MANTKIPAELSSTPGIIDNSNATAITIDSSENVGIGTGSPTRTFEVNSGTANAVARFESTDSRALIEFKDNVGTASIGNIGTNLTFFPDNATEAMRIDSSGNLLVGQSSSAVPGSGNTVTGISIAGQYDAITISRADAQGLIVNRNSEGKLVDFNKDGSTVGSIGITGTNDIEIHSTAANHTGLRLGEGYYIPVDNAGLGTDGTVDLGLASIRYKDLYLSGGVYVGGTGSANKLDDYEEGTWTPSVVSGNANFGNSTYTKVGRIVHCFTQCGSFTDTTSGNSVAIGSLPFTAIASDKATTLGSLAQHIGTGFGTITGAYLESSTSLRLYNTSASGFRYLKHSDLNGSSSVYIAFTYMSE